MIKNSAAALAPTMVVVLNWVEELQAKLPVPHPPVHDTVVLSIMATWTLRPQARWNR
jgi:hypothetical protein